MASASARTLLVQRGRRFANSLRPATLIYGTARIPCCPGNLEFFEQLRADGGGFSGFQNLHVTIIRSDVPSGMVFHKGDACAVVDTESGDRFELIVGDNNSRSAAVLILNLKKAAG